MLTGSTRLEVVPTGGGPAGSMYAAMLMPFAIEVRVTAVKARSYQDSDVGGEVD